MLEISRLYKEGIPGFLNPNPIIAHEWCMRAAESDNAIAEFMLGYVKKKMFISFGTYILSSVDVVFILNLVLVFVLIKNKQWYGIAKLPLKDTVLPKPNLICHKPKERVSSLTKKLKVTLSNKAVKAKNIMKKVCVSQRNPEELALNKRIAKSCNVYLSELINILISSCNYYSYFNFIFNYYLLQPRNLFRYIL